MNKLIRNTYNNLKHDRPYVWLMFAILGLGTVYVIYCLLSIHASDVQIISHYSGVGDTHFYKDKWFSLYNFVGFGVLATFFNLALLAKLHEVEQREIGIVTGWVAIAVIVVAAVYTFGVLHLAYL